MSAQTETGPLSLMPKNNNNHKNQKSIHSFVDGFSFCTPTEAQFFSYSSTDHSFKALLDPILKEHDPLEQLHWVSFESPSLFVPEALYDTAHKARYLEYFISYDDTFEIAEEYLKEHQLYNLFPQSKQIKKELTTKPLKVSFSHANSLLYKEIRANIKEENNEKTFYIHLQKNAFDLFVFEGKNFQLYNRFTIKNVDEFLYFLFFVVEQYQLEADQFSLIFMGEFTAFNSIYTATKDYHKSVSFLNSEQDSSIALSLHHAPFLLNL